MSKKKKGAIAGVAAAVVLLLGIGGYFLAEEKVVTDNTAMNYELRDFILRFHLCSM